MVGSQHRRYLGCLVRRVSRHPQAVHPLAQVLYPLGLTQVAYPLGSVATWIQHTEGGGTFIGLR